MSSWEGNQYWLRKLSGWLAPDMYSTAWVAMVPDLRLPDQPAWPQALAQLRAGQLDDGGWGDPHVFYAHERTVSTLAAIRALTIWGYAEDMPRIERGLDALWDYADAIADEPHEPTGFELVLPRLAQDLKPIYGERLPLAAWEPVEVKSRQKLALIMSLEPQPNQQQAWWFSLEMLPEQALLHATDAILNENGSIETATAPTAAYLGALRRAGLDSPRAAAWLAYVVDGCAGGVPFCWPAEVFERVWALDGFMRAGLNPHTPSIYRVAEYIRHAWNQDEPGLSSSTEFRVNDGDDTLVGFTILNWAGFEPDDKPILRFWDDDHFRSYHDERSASVSANIHGLTALRTQPGFPHRGKAEKLTDWLLANMNEDTIFDDKWHLSPYYSLSHAVPAFAGWDDEVAMLCLNRLLQSQRSDGGWGSTGRSTQEETAHCVLALWHGYQSGLLVDRRPLESAGAYFAMQNGLPRERWWIGKTSFRPEGIVEATVFSARYLLDQAGLLAYETAV